ncbi:MAG: hypothetical protein U5K69_11990 [Balneolaceae bacterium]|nr:hypothetical protein [Balneolaceae bacterium]
MIHADIEKAHYLTDLIQKDEELERAAPAPLSIVCFRYRPSGIDKSYLNEVNNRLINKLEADGHVFLTGTEINDKTVLRACLINPRTKKHINQLIRIVKELGSELK